MRCRFSLLLLCLLASAGFVSADATIPSAPGYGVLEYEVPDPGSYELPALGHAADGLVLTSDNRQRRLYDIFGGKYVLLSFIYSRCDDVNGCPLSSYVLYQIKAAMNQQPLLAKNLKLVTLSFDPQHDTAEVLRLYANNFKYAGERGEWDFLSTRSEKELEPILESYGQEIQREVGLGGEARYSHLLRVFLIDPKLRIRNIYSVAFLHKDLLLADVKTLLLEDKAKSLSTDGSKKSDSIALRPGDDKTNYENADYRTHALAIEERKGHPTDLMAYVKKPPLGLPVVPQPDDNPVTEEKIALGRKLFYDRRLSLNDTFSCGMCHIPEQGFSNNELATAVGIEGRTVRRNAPTIYNSAYHTRLFHDGREFNLEQQIWGPLLAKNEMGMPSVGFVVNKVRRLDDYRGLFEQAFGEAASMETIGQALASYQRTLVSANSAFDRWFYGHDSMAMSESAQNGFRLFTGKAGCASCHLVNEKYALFTDDRLHNTGIGYRESMPKDDSSVEKVQLAPGVFVNVQKDIIRSVGHEPLADVGLYEITENPDDRWKYKTPSLRNIALTAPYMHNGSIDDLMGVIEFYNQGGVNNDLLDKRIHPLGLNPQEKEDLLAFLKSLTGSNVETLVSDAFAAPIGDPGSGQAAKANMTSKVEKIDEH
jgi:cytochrome c peroxidase